MSGEDSLRDTEAFTDKIAASRTIIEDVFNATEAAALLDQADRLDAKVDRDERADLRTDIHEAVVHLRFEIEEAAGRGDQWAARMMRRWDGGLVGRLERGDLGGRDAHQLAVDVAQAAYRLGYTNVRYATDDADDMPTKDDGPSETVEAIRNME